MDNFPSILRGDLCFLTLRWHGATEAIGRATVSPAMRHPGQEDGERANGT